MTASQARHPQDPMADRSGSQHLPKDAGTPPLQMLRAEVPLRDFQRWMGARRLNDVDHATHCLLVECFGEFAPKPFRLIMPRGGSVGVLYGYGTATAEVLCEQAAVNADPLQARIVPGATIDTKPMPSTWRVGRRLGFEARIRPIARRSTRGGAAGGERDAFQMEAALHLPGGMQRTREEVYAAWLSRELDRRGGARLETETATLVSFRRTRSTYRSGGRPTEGPDAIMRGSLTITDGSAFNDLLARGVGRHRTYGYGMLLLRPV